MRAVLNFGPESKELLRDFFARACKEEPEHDVIIDANRRKMRVTCGDMVPLNLTEAEST